MDIINAVAKVRFASARPQRVHLARTGTCGVELLCMEAGQDARISSGGWTYYVVMGTARVAAGSEAADLTPGQVAVTGPDEAHSVANAGEGRLVCLAIGPA